MILLQSTDKSLQIGCKKSDDHWLYLIKNGKDHLLIYSEDDDYLPFKCDGEYLYVDWHDGAKLKVKR